MTKRIDTAGNNVDKDLERRVRQLETASPLRNASVTKGRVRIGGTAVLLVDSDGGLQVDGRFTGVGNFIWDGLARFLAAVEITDTLDVSAETVLRGATNIKNTLDVEAATKLRGALELLASMVVKAGGSITVEGDVPVLIGTTGNGAGIQFGSGTTLTGADGGAAIRTASGARVGASVLGATMAFGSNSIVSSLLGNDITGLTTITVGTSRVLVNTAGTRVTGPLYADLPGRLVSGIAANQVRWDPVNGQMYRTL